MERIRTELHEHIDSVYITTYILCIYSRIYVFVFTSFVLSPGFCITAVTQLCDTAVGQKSQFNLLI